jgi:hypothetical protein
VATWVAMTVAADGNGVSCLGRSSFISCRTSLVLVWMIGSSMSSTEVSIELLTLLVGGSGAVLACLDAGLYTCWRDILDGKKLSLMSPAQGATLDYGCYGLKVGSIGNDREQCSCCTPQEKIETKIVRQGDST